MLSVDDPVVARLRRHDRDRFLATMFAPPERRPALWALLAFNLELARVRETVTQPMLGQIRLAWWREAITEAYGNGPVRRHEVASPLAEAIHAHAIRREPLDALIDGRERDLDPTPPATMAELLAYAEATASRLIEAQLDVLGAESAAARPAGIAWALIGLMRAVPFHAASGRSWIPQDVAAEAGLGANARFASSPALSRAIRAVALTAEQQLVVARALPPPRVALPALLPCRVAGAYLRTLRRAAFDPWAAAVARPDAWAAARMWWGSAIGRA